MRLARRSLLAAPALLRAAGAGTILDAGPAGAHPHPLYARARSTTRSAG